jgi:pteridine reductase
MAEYPLAIVTGGAHRLGRAFALTLAYQGYGVLIHFHKSFQDAKKTVEDIASFNVPAFSYEADLLNPSNIHGLFEYMDSLISTSQSGLSGLTVLVNSAAYMNQVEFQKLSIDEWNLTMDLNLRAPFLCAQQAALRMEQGGQIINVSDVGVQKTWSHFPAYVVSKAGLETLTRVLARVLAPKIRVNAIAPGLVIPAKNFSSSEWEKLTTKLPLKRSGTAEEVASALEFLLKNQYITGQTIVVDGGYSLV